MKTSKVEITICKTSDDSYNLCIESDGSGTRLLGGKGNGSYSAVQVFKIDEEKIDNLISELTKYKKYLRTKK